MAYQYASLSGGFNGGRHFVFIGKLVVAFINFTRGKLVGRLRHLERQTCSVLSRAEGPRGCSDCCNKSIWLQKVVYRIKLVSQAYQEILGILGHCTNCVNC